MAKSQAEVSAWPIPLFGRPDLLHVIGLVRPLLERVFHLLEQGLNFLSHRFSQRLVGLVDG